MSIKLRFSLLLGVLLLAFLFCLFLLRQAEKQQLAEAIANSRNDDADLLENWLDITGTSLRQFTEDYALWDDMARFVAQPDKQWGHDNIDLSLANFGLHAAWVYRPEGTIAYAASSPPVAPPPLSAEQLRALTQNARRLHFFAHSPAGLIEVRGAAIVFASQATQPGSPPPPIQGWLLAARAWNQPYIDNLARLIEGTISIDSPDQPAPEANGQTRLTLLRPLDDWRGDTIALLRIVRETPALAQRLRSEALATRIFVIFGLCLVVTLGLSLHLWVLAPLGRIGDSLARHDTAPIRDLSREHTELARVARLVESTFEQRELLRQEIAERTSAEAALQRTLDERARLGRDLHDGVIQSIYAAGMGLSAAQSQLQTRPAEAAARVEEVRAVLNDTIRDVRNFITGLEPEALQRSTFANAVNGLVATLHTASQEVEARVNIDERLADQLPLAVRTEALQIIREAISNAVRHGRARLVEISFTRANGDARLTIADNGAGFSPDTVRRGRGLDNIAERVRLLGAHLDIRSSPGNGTRIHAIFRLNES